jgi:predicted phage tail component-like protein
MRYKVRVNGTYLSDLVPGYITTDVKGREQADNEITSLTSERIDGEEYRYRRRNPKIITIKFAISTGSMEELTEAHNKLKAALSVEQAKFIFDDEPDKYWIGTPVSMEVEHLRPDTTTGEISVKVHKPYKYGLAESNVPFVDGVAEVYYSGTVPTYPVIHADMTANDGYISFSKDEETVMFGDEEDDGTTPTDPDAAVEYIANRDGLPTAGDTWSYNDGTLPALSAAVAKTGAMGLTTWTPTNLRLYASDFGTDNNAWHGPSMTYHLTGSKTDCALTVYHRQEATDNGQKGLFQIALTDTDGNDIASCRFVKSTAGSMDSGIDIFIAGSKKKTIGFRMIKDNPITGPGVTAVSKSGSTIAFSFNGKTYQFTDASLEAVEVKEFTLYFAKSKTATYINTSYVTGFRFVAPDGSVEMHTFWDGDQVEIDCGQGQIKVNGAETPSIGRVRNAWEKMQLVPGKNVFTMDYSDWANTPPSARLTYREVYA